MLAHPDVNFSTIPAELQRSGHRGACNRWLQSRSMRIELPPASWADVAHRADDDAHTLTLIAPSTPEWDATPLALADPALALRTQVDASAPVTLTLTLAL